jgi:hypothetical protein
MCGGFAPIKDLYKIRWQLTLYRWRTGPGNRDCEDRMSKRTKLARRGGLLEQLVGEEPGTETRIHSRFCCSPFPFTAPQQMIPFRSHSNARVKSGNAREPD